MDCAAEEVYRREGESSSTSYLDPFICVIIVNVVKLIVAGKEDGLTVDTTVFTPVIRECSIQDGGAPHQQLQLVTLVYMPKRMGGSRFEFWFGLGSYLWILGDFHPGFIPRYLTFTSTNPNSNLSPIEKCSSIISCCLYMYSTRASM